jgi:hypothetical protein
MCVRNALATLSSRLASLTGTHEMDGRFYSWRDLPPSQKMLPRSYDA